jgi:hypothetical protein
MRKTAQISVRVSEQEMANLRSIADHQSVLLSELIRGLLSARDSVEISGILGKLRQKGRGLARGQERSSEKLPEFPAQPTALGSLARLISRV